MRRALFAAVACSALSLSLSCGGNDASERILTPAPGRHVVELTVGAAQARLVAYAIAAVRDVLSAGSVSCGDVITTDVTLSADLACPAGFTGVVLTIGADAITFDGASHTITAPDAAVIFSANAKTGISIQNVIVAPGVGTGTGIQLTSVINSTVSGISVTGRGFGIQGVGGNSGNLLQGNTLSGNVTGISFVGEDNTFKGNDLSNNSSFGLAIGGSDFRISNDNDFSGSSNGLLVINATGATIENLDFPSSVANTVLDLQASTDVTVRNITAPGTGTGAGVRLANVTNSRLTGVTVTGRGFGIQAISGNDGNLLQGNTLTGNVTGISFVGEDNTFEGNDLSNNSSFGLAIGGSDFRISNDNDFSGSSNGLLVINATGATIENLDFPSSVANTVLDLQASTDVTVRNITAPGTGTGAGVRLANVTNSRLTRVTVTGRGFGIQAVSGNDSNLLQGNTLTGNVTGISFAGEGNIFEGNDLSNNSSFGLAISGSDFRISNDNDFSGSSNGLLVINATGATIEDLDFPSSVANTVLDLQASTDVTVRNITAPGTGTGTGVRLANVTNSRLTRVTVTGRGFGIQAISGNDGNLLQGNTLTGNVTGISFAGDGNTFEGNDLSNNSSFGLAIGGSDFRISNDNDFSGSSNGLLVINATGATIENLDFPSSVANTVLDLQASTDVTVRNITAPGTGTGTGVRLINVTNSRLTGVTVTGRDFGIQAISGSDGNLLKGNTLTGNVTGISFAGEGNTFSGNDLSNNSHFGLAMRGSNVTAGPGNAITNNGIGVLSSASADVNVNNNAITGNVTFGIQNTEDAVVINAKNNYWGDPSGPLDNNVPVGGQGDRLGLSNPTGLGDAVTDFVDYEPFLGSVGATENLMTMIEHLPIDPGQQIALLATLENVVASIQKGNAAAARGQLTGFARQVEALQRSVVLDGAAATVLLAQAAAILAGL